MSHWKIDRASGLLVPVDAGRLSVPNTRRHLMAPILAARRRPRASSGGGGGGDATEPVYDDAIDTVHHVGDSDDPHYDDAESWGADVDPTLARFYPRPSAIGGTPAADGAVTPTLISGLDGGKAFSIAYVGNANEDPNVSLMRCPMAEGRVGIIQFQLKVGGSFSKTTTLTSKFILAWGSVGGRWQWALHGPWPPLDYYPDPPDISNGYRTVILPLGPLEQEDDNFAPPLGGDYGMQKRGPYIFDLLDGAWHRVTAMFWSHNPDNVTKDGGMRLWFDGIKVNDVSPSSVGVEVPGEGYPWCTANMQEIQFRHNEGVTTNRSLTFGADASGATTPWQQIINIGDADIENPNTFKFFSRARATITP